MEKKVNTFFREELAPSYMPKRVKKEFEKTVKFRDDSTKNMENLKKEMILRRSMYETFLEYMTNSSLSGVRFLVDDSKSVKEKCMWFVIIGSAIFGFFYVMNDVFKSQEARPIYLTLEDIAHPIKNIIFPAIAICNHNRVKKSAVERLVDVLYSHDNSTFTSKEELFNLSLMYGSFYDFTLPTLDQILTYTNFIKKIENKIDRNENITSDKISQLLQSLSPTCEDILLRCAWRGVIANCSSLFQTAITQFGFCCTFNYYNTEAGRLAKDPVSPEDEPYFLEDGGLYNGLTVAANANTHEYLYATRQSRGFDILFFDRYDYADQTAGGLKHRLVSAGEQYEMVINPYRYYAVPAIKGYSLDKRGCKFNDESQNEFHNYYSLSNCIVRCRMRTLERLCGCIPFFMPKRSNLSICAFNDLYCLNKYREKLLFVYPPQDLPGLETERENSLACPHCFPDCRATRYNVNHNRIMRVRRNASVFVQGLNLDDGNVSIIRINYASQVFPLYRLDVTSYWYEKVSSVGGLCGFFTGFSMVSLAEFFYFFCIRFIAILLSNCRRYS